MICHRDLAGTSQEVARKRHDYAVESNDLLFTRRLSSKKLPLAAGTD